MMRGKKTLKIALQNKPLKIAKKKAKLQSVKISFS